MKFSVLWLGVLAAFLCPPPGQAQAVAVQGGFGESYFADSGLPGLEDNDPTVLSAEEAAALAPAAGDEVKSVGGNPAFWRADDDTPDFVAGSEEGIFPPPPAE